MARKQRGKQVSMQMVDDALLFRVAANDRQAFETLYNSTKTAIYGFLLSIVRNPHTAEDIMQEVYIKVYLSAASYTPKGKPMAWLLTIARNLALMKLREKSSKFTLLTPEEFTKSNLSDPEKALDTLVLEAAMNYLQDDERQIVILHDIAGLKHRETARILQMPLSTVLSKYRRSLVKLQKQFKEDA